ncbi:hypothetical protein [Mesorhizobium sp. 10J20-29]
MIKSGLMKATSGWLVMVWMAFSSIAIGQPIENPFATDEEAYAWLLESPTYPRDSQSKDEFAVARIQREPELVLPKLKPDLEKAAAEKPTFYKSYAVFLDLANAELQLQIARDSVKTYGLNDRSPFSQYLAAHGGPEDMERIKQEMEADPDGWAVGLASAIVFNGNDSGVAMLEVLKQSLPGPWQYALDGVQATIPDLPSNDAEDRSEEEVPIIHN